MDLEFELTSSDVEAFYRRANRSAWWLVAFEWCIVVTGLVVIDWFFFRKQPAIALAIPVIGIGSYALRRWQSRHKSYERNVQAIANDQHGLLGHHRLCIGSDGFEHQRGPVRAMSRWDEVKRVVETEDYFFLTYGLAGGTIIPKRAFADSKQLAWFRGVVAPAAQHQR